VPSEPVLLTLAVSNRSLCSSAEIYLQVRRGGCGLGLRQLRAYRKEWDESRGVWKDRPRHDEASHGAEAFFTFACSNYTPPSALPTKKRDTRWVV
jgi:hypothetical protein